MAEGHEAQSAGPKATSHVDNLQVVGVVGSGAKRDGRAKWGGAVTLRRTLTPLPGLALTVTTRRWGTGTQLAGIQERSPGRQREVGIKRPDQRVHTHLVSRGLDVQSPLGEGGFHADEEGELLDPGGGGYLGGAGLWDGE